MSRYHNNLAQDNLQVFPSADPDVAPSPPTANPCAILFGTYAEVRAEFPQFPIPRTYDVAFTPFIPEPKVNTFTCDYGHALNLEFLWDGAGFGSAPGPFVVVQHVIAGNQPVFLVAYNDGRKGYFQFSAANRRWAQALVDRTTP